MLGAGKEGLLNFNYGTLPQGGGKPICPSLADGRKQILEAKVDCTRSPLFSF
jgi:hypothetical protein